MLAALLAACCAANGVPLRDPRNPRDPELFHDRTFPAWSEIVTIVLLKDAWMCTTPNETCLRSFFLKVFFLPFFSGAAAPPAAAAGLAMKISPWLLTVGSWQRPSHYRLCQRATANSCFYVFAAAFFLFATVPLRGPLRVRALVCVRCPRTGRLRRWRFPR